MINLYLFIISPIFTAVMIYIFQGKRAKLAALFLQAILLATAIANFVHVKYYGIVVQHIGGWEQYSGIALRADLLASVMVMLTAFMFLAMLAFNYAKEYVNHLFLFLFLVLQALIMAVFLSQDLFNIYVLVEVSTIIVSILIMFKKDSQSIYDGMVYLLVNIVAMILFLFGVGYIYKIFGVLDMSAVQNRMKLIEHPQTVIIPYALMMTAVGLKSALLPLFSWLPKAHGTPSAPSIVSAVLSGLYVKGGVYLFIRIQEMYAGMIDTSEYFMLMGFLTGVVGFVLALSQTDIKLILAYHTISQIGLIMIGLSYPSEYTYWGAVYHIINHAFFKSTLFLTAGIIIEEYGTRNLWEIKGVFKRMPLIASASVLAILGITGAPFFNGSISKYFIQAGMKGTVLEYGILFINLGTIVSFIKYSSMFWGTGHSEKSHIDIYRRTVTVLLAAICFIGGIFGQSFISLLFNFKVSIDWISYAQKAAIYIVTLAVGTLIYKKVIAKSRILYRVREIELGFNDICVSMTFFFSMTALYLAIKYML